MIRGYINWLLITTALASTRFALETDSNNPASLTLSSGEEDDASLAILTNQLPQDSGRLQSEMRSTYDRIGVNTQLETRSKEFIEQHSPASLVVSEEGDEQTTSPDFSTNTSSPSLKNTLPENKESKASHPEETSTSVSPTTAKSEIPDLPNIKIDLLLQPTHADANEGRGKKTRSRAGKGKRRRRRRKDPLGTRSRKSSGRSQVKTGIFDLTTLHYQGKDSGAMGCLGLRSKRYISDGFCLSMRPVTEVICTGNCVAGKRLPWMPLPKQQNSKMVEHKCVEDVVKRKKVQLQCPNGDHRTYRIKVVRSCACKKTDPNSDPRLFMNSNWSNQPSL